MRHGVSYCAMWLFIPKILDIGPRVLLLDVKKLNANRVLWTYFPTFVDIFSYTPYFLVDVFS